MREIDFKWDGKVVSGRRHTNEGLRCKAVAKFMRYVRPMDEQKQLSEVTDLVQLTVYSRLQAGIDGFAFEGENTKEALVHAAFGGGAGGFVLDNVPMLEENAVLDAENVAGDPVDGKAEV